MNHNMKILKDYNLPLFEKWKEKHDISDIHFNRKRVVPFYNKQTRLSNYIDIAKFSKNCNIVEVSLPLDQVSNVAEKEPFYSFLDFIFGYGDYDSIPFDENFYIFSAKNENILQPDNSYKWCFVIKMAFASPRDAGLVKIKFC